MYFEGILFPDLLILLVSYTSHNKGKSNKQLSLVNYPKTEQKDNLLDVKYDKKNIESDGKQTISKLVFDEEYKEDDLNNKINSTRMHRRNVSVMIKPNNTTISDKQLHLISLLENQIHENIVKIEDLNKENYILKKENDNLTYKNLQLIKTSIMNDITSINISNLFITS